ncbi:MAG TPA: GDP-mannose dehydrogenase, partial [bacterium]
MSFSTSPDGKQYTIPNEEDQKKEFERLKRTASGEREKGREIVVVMGLGFVGAVMAAVVADSTEKATGKTRKFVIGMQRPSPRSYWKIPFLNSGLSPVKAEDPEVDILIHRCVVERKNLVATCTTDALSLADTVIVDVQCDFLKKELGNCTTGRAEIGALEESMKIIGEKIQPNCLVLIETTVPPGTT